MQGQLGELLSSILKVLEAISTLRNQLFAPFFFHAKLLEKIHLNYVRVGKGCT